MPAPTHISRRAFLGAGLTTLFASAACNLPGRNGGVIYVTTTPQPSPTPPSLDFLPTSIPDLAGEVVALNAGTITLRAVSGERSYSLAGDAAITGTGGEPAGLDALAPSVSAAVWLDAEARSALRMQVLPEMEALPPSFGGPAQSTPTGETRLIGALPTQGSPVAITRAGWGAAEPDLNAAQERGTFEAETNPEGWLVYPGALADWLTTIVVHHTALRFSEGPREIQRFHQTARGYADIAYHFLIDSFGVLYEGRSLNARGSHTGGANTGTVGIVLAGNYNLIPVLRAPLATLSSLILALAGDYSITHVAGHRDFQPFDTECPGDNLEAVTPQIAAGLGLEFGTSGYVTPPWNIPPDTGSSSSESP